MKIAGEQMRLYAVTDRILANTDDELLRQISDAIDGGAGVVQLREKHLPDARLLELARRFVALCREKGAISIINDRADIAVQAGADGVHVGQDDLEAGRARAVLGPDRILGVSAHSVEEALRAQEAGADYIGVGAAFATGTKTDARPIDHAVYPAITRAVHIPAVAIGGITQGNILQLGGCGLSGVAVVSAIFGQVDVKSAARRMRALAEEIAR